MPAPQPQREPDMFEGGRQLLQFVGRLTHDAEVRMKAIGPDDKPMPVLCLDIKIDGPGERIVHAEQAYPRNDRFAADAQALRLRQGALVSIKADPQAMRLSLPLVEEIQLHA